MDCLEFGWSVSVTFRARRCLTSVINRELVHSTHNGPKRGGAGIKLKLCFFLLRNMIRNNIRNMLQHNIIIIFGDHMNFFVFKMAIRLCKTYGRKNNFSHPSMAYLWGNVSN